MNIRYRTALMSAEGTATPASPAAPVVAPTAPTPVVVAPAPVAGEEFKSMTSEQFAQRLSKEREQGTKSLVKDLGFEKVDDIKALLAKAKEEAEAKKTTEQKTQEKLAALEPMAAKAVELEAAVKTYLFAEESAIPAEKKALLDLAPPIEQPHARLAWIAKAKAQGLFNVTTPAPTAVTPPALANTRAGTGNPPPPAPTPGQKHPRDMTDAEFRQYEANWKANKGAAPRG